MGIQARKVKMVIAVKDGNGEIKNVTTNVAQLINHLLTEHEKMQIFVGTLAGKVTELEKKK